MICEMSPVPADDHRSGADAASDREVLAELKALCQDLLDRGSDRTSFRTRVLLQMLVLEIARENQARIAHRH